MWKHGSNIEIRRYAQIWERQREWSASIMRMKTGRLIAVPLATTRHTNTHVKEKALNTTSMTKPLARPLDLSWATLCCTKNIERLSVHLPHTSAAVPPMHKLCLELTFFNNILHSLNKSTLHSSSDNGTVNSACFHPSTTFFFYRSGLDWSKRNIGMPASAALVLVPTGRQWWNGVFSWPRDVLQL